MGHRRLQLHLCAKEGQPPGFPSGEATPGRLGNSCFKMLLPTFDPFPWEKCFHFKTVLVLMEKETD